MEMSEGHLSELERIRGWACCFEPERRFMAELEIDYLKDELAKPQITHLSHGLTLQVTPKHKLLCFNPNDNDRAAREMWLAHTEERLRQNVSLRLITKDKPETLLGYPVKYVEFDDDEFTDPKDIVLGPPWI